MQSSSGTYKIQKGQKIVGNCHLAQRDKKVFEVPGCKGVDEFDPSRFKQKVSKSPSLPYFVVERVTSYKYIYKFDKFV